MNLSRRTFIFAGIVFPVVLLAVYSYLNIRNQTIERLYEERRALASLSAGILNEKLERINDLALSFSTRVLLSPLVEQQKWDAAIELVKNIPEDFDYIDRVFITDTTGTLMAEAPSNPELKGKNYAQFDWYIGFMKSQQPYLSPVYKRTVSPYSMVSAFAVPIKNNEGKVRGILVLQVNMDNLLLWGKSVKAGSNGFLYVVDQKGRIAIHPSYTNTDSISDYSQIPVVQKALKGEKNVEILYHTIEKEDRLVAYEQIPGYGWAVIVTQEAKEALSAGSILNFTVVMYAFIILFACFLAYFITREMNLRKKSEISLRESEEKFRNLINLSPVGITLSLADGKIVETNQAILDMFGMASKEEFLNKSAMEFYVDKNDRLQMIEMFKKDGIVKNFETRLKRKNGEHIWVSSHVILFKMPSGETVLLSASVDITHRKKAEEQLQAVNKELEAFSYSVSHDLRAPLRAVNGYAKILLEDYEEKIDEDGISALQAIMNNSKKMGVLIDDLLAFSRLGRKEIATSEINMNALVRTVRDEILNGEEKETEFKVEQLPPALGDQSLIRQVWVNLISNAIKYSQHKPRPLIEIGAFSNGSTVEYYVKDNGAGFDMQYYDKLFGVFQRLHSQDEFEGTGIGLANVQKIISRHNGTVRAEAKVNEGASFYFSLPQI